jgi:hypothetical protein
MTRNRLVALLAALALVIGLPSFAGAQALAGYSAVQLGPPINPVVPYVTGTASDSGTINKQLTVTITPQAGQYVYVHGWDLSACQNATSTVMTNVTFTTTGFTNLPKIAHLSLAATANICATPVAMNFGANPMKSATPGAAVTFVSPAATAQAAFTLNVYASTGP